MHKHYNKFLIVSSIFILIGGVYTYFSNNLDAQAAPALSSSSQEGKVSPLGPVNDQISQDTAFLTTLTSLKKLQINTSIFSNKSFTSLVDNTVMLESVVPGRKNPFAPIGNNSQQVAVISSTPVVTDEPTQITNKGAFLNGSVDNASNGVTNTYFEYGTTESLGETTPEAKQSLIGNFFVTLTNLTPKTTYYYSAVARINGALNYGEIVSFTTK